ncbi:MAG TPA: hypothetical protein VNB49_03875 [Candidatus Dormibacteraeota bacterium]|nr:hypothetical protein [Candidatus Dormibacteraeota bacterium]
MRQAAVGLRVHSGWSAMVAVCVEKGAPRVLARERVQLVETFTYRFRQPYHTAEKMPLGEARKFVSRVQAEAGKLAYRAIHSAQADLEKQGITLTRFALLLASGRVLPSFEKILASHALIHTADGELFREALLSGAKGCGLEMIGIKERELLERGRQMLRVQSTVLLRRITELGKIFGSPWSQDEKFATLAAWLALGSHKSNTIGGKTKNRKESTERTQRQRRRDHGQDCLTCDRQGIHRLLP